MGILKNYDPNQVVVLIGAIPVSGFADGAFVNVEKNSDAFTLVVGSGGEGCRTRNRDESGTVTLTLMQSSEVNALLSAAHELDKSLPAGAGALPLMIKDLTGTTLVAAELAWIRKVSNVEFGKEAGSREWVLESSDLRVFAGGN